MTAGTGGRIAGLDYLRAVFSVCVVAVHLNYVFQSLIFDPRQYRAHSFTASDFVNFYVLCLAVPVFVLISTFLYARKPADGRGLRRRLGRLLRLLVFWSVLLQVFRLTGIGAVKSLPHDAQDWPLFLMSGGNTVYYFFLALAVVTAVTHYAARLPGRAVWVLFALSTLVVGVLPLVHRATGILLVAHHSNPLNFVPYAFAGVGLARLYEAGAGRTLSRVGLACLALAVPAALLDWTVYVDECFFRINEFAIPAYTRPSLVFLAVAVLVPAVRSGARGNAVVGFMAYHSLGVYCLHPFFIDLKFKLIEVLHLTEPLATFVPVAVVLALSYAGSMVMPLFVREELIR
jgi:surface polysaccharide O-acyltransferase-like enzyme